MGPINNTEHTIFLRVLITVDGQDQIANRLAFLVASVQPSGKQTSHRQNQLFDAWYEKYRLSLFGGALSLYSVLFKSTLNNANMQRNWLHGFRSLNCWEWIKGCSLSLRSQPCWELSKHIPRLFQWFPTVVRSLILWKRKTVTSQLSLFW